MKTLIVYYSRTGVTKRVAEILSVKLKAELEAIIDTQDRSGLRGYVKSGYEAVTKKVTQIKPLNHELSAYDLVVVGTPVWAGTMATPVRAFLLENKNKLKQVAFFCTMGGSGADQTFTQMGALSGKKPVGTLSLLTRDVVKNDCEDKLNNFIKGYAK